MSRLNSIKNEQLTDTTYYILLCLTEPDHGYALMRKIQHISCGTFIVGPASMYTNLKKLLDAHLIEIVEIDKKSYQLTPEGTRLLVEEYKRRSQIVEQSKNIIENIRRENNL
ncbi:PadR family transcriptional regulator [Clostridium sp. C8-1-8]|uniref:PadR family transcriptional regulator n=1 Tax=Clostridium sp. C8-1-8 TaxID=2698831 RepID=UPI00136F3A5F|nr:PadR family transcriptional regulator [Clostridium sp. C8-1-8]